MKIGVLALQGDVREHLQAFRSIGVAAEAVKSYQSIEAVDALVIPGGESTVIGRLAEIFGVADLIRHRISHGMPVYGSCAGMILLADEIEDNNSNQKTFGGLQVSVRRNAFGRQVDSFESDINFQGIEGSPVRAIFIRAPWIEKIGNRVEVLASIEGHPVAVRQGNIFATSFHPELTEDHRIHSYFIEKICREEFAVQKSAKVGLV
jgi:5'-phosphate synthase pdxT subunit